MKAKIVIIFSAIIACACNLNAADIQKIENAGLHIKAYTVWANGELKARSEGGISSSIPSEKIDKINSTATTALRESVNQIKSMYPLQASEIIDKWEKPDPANLAKALNHNKEIIFSSAINWYQPNAEQKVLEDIEKWQKQITTES